MLSHIKTCLQHQLKLVRTCQCGMGLNCFDMETPPFICCKCGCSWEDLPRIEASPERIVLEEQLQSYYAFFFSVGTPRLLSQTFELIEMRSLECGKKSLPFDALSEETGHGPRYIGKDYHQDYRSFVKMKRVSLGKLAYALVDLELSIGDILKYAEQAADCISDVNDDRISYQGDYCNSMNKSVLTEQSGYRTKSA